MEARLQIKKFLLHWSYTCTGRDQLIAVDIPTEGILSKFTLDNDTSAFRQPGSGCKIAERGCAIGPTDRCRGQGASPWEVVDGKGWGR